MPKKQQSLNLKNSLQASLKGAAKVAVLGIGSDLRGDDISGIIAVQELEKKADSISRTIPFKTFLGYTAPENLSGEIRKFSPTHLIMIDTADIKKKPGDIMVFTAESAGGMSFSTHKLPVKVMAEYLKSSIGCEVIIVGIQPKTLDFGKPVSKVVEDAAKAVADDIKELLSAK